VLFFSFFLSFWRKPRRRTDRELYELKDYLRLIAIREADFTKLRHKDWKLYLATHRRLGTADSNPNSVVGHHEEREHDANG